MVKALAKFALLMKPWITGEPTRFQFAHYLGAMCGVVDVDFSKYENITVDVLAMATEAMGNLEEFDSWAQMYIGTVDEYSVLEEDKLRKANERLEKKKEGLFDDEENS